MAKKDYLIEVEAIIEMDCLPILSMISECASSELAMLT